MARKIADEIERFCEDRQLGLSLRDVAIKNDYSPNRLQDLLYQGEKDLDDDLDTPYRKFFVQWHSATVELKAMALKGVQRDKKYNTIIDMLTAEEESNTKMADEILINILEDIRNGTKNN